MAKKITKQEATKAAKTVAAYTKQEAKKHGTSMAKQAKKIGNKTFGKLKKLF